MNSKSEDPFDSVLFPEDRYTKLKVLEHFAAVRTYVLASKTEYEWESSRSQAALPWQPSLLSYSPKPSV